MGKALLRLLKTLLCTVSGLRFEISAEIKHNIPERSPRPPWRIRSEIRWNKLIGAGMH